MKFELGTFGIVVFFGLFVSALIFVLVDIQYKDVRLKDSDERAIVEKQLKGEIASLGSPDKTAGLDTNTYGKWPITVGVIRRYRSELNEPEVWAYFHENLGKLGWSYLGTDREHPFVRRDIYCKGDYRGRVSLESKSVFNNDDGNYFRVELELTSSTLSEPRPSKCRLEN